MKTYVMVWDEKTGWYFFKEDFSIVDFPNGYVDFWIEVQDNIIISDTFKPSNVGEKFNIIYENQVWI